jgi:hypothetical protein
MTSDLGVDVKFSSAVDANCAIMLAAPRCLATIPRVGHHCAGITFVRVAVQPVNAPNINTLDPE